MEYLQSIDIQNPAFGDFYDELPLWSAPFGMMILDCVPLRRGARILDVGAGTGFLTLELAQRCGPDTQVIAVDPWRSAVTRLRHKLNYLQLSNVKLYELDAAELELQDASIDLFVSNLGVNNFADPGAVLRNCGRLAKPGADFILSSNLVGHMQEFYEVFEDTLIECGQKKRVAALHAHIEKRASVVSLRRLLDESGFQVQQINSANFRMRFADGSAFLRHHFIRLGFLSDWAALMKAGTESTVFELLEVRLNELAAKSGELALTIPMACLWAQRSEP